MRIMDLGKSLVGSCEKLSIPWIADFEIDALYMDENTIRSTYKKIDRKVGRKHWKSISYYNCERRIKQIGKRV